MPGFVDDAFIAHHGAKARGGTGWIGGETFLSDSLDVLVVVPLPVRAPHALHEVVDTGHVACHQGADIFRVSHLSTCIN